MRSDDGRGDLGDALSLLTMRLQRLAEMTSTLAEMPLLDGHEDMRRRSLGDPSHSEGGALDEIEQALGALDDHVGSASRDALADLDGAAGEAVRALEVEDEAVRAADDSLDAHGADTHGAITGLVDRVRQDEEAVGGAHSEARDAVQGLSGEARDEHTGSTRDIFERAGETLSARCLDVVGEGFDALGQHADQSFDALHDGVRGASEGWSRAVGHLLTESAQEITRTFLREVREGTEELIREGVREILEEFAEQAVSMATGAATTTALGPLLPELIAAKRLLHTANELLDYFGLD